MRYTLIMMAQIVGDNITCGNKKELRINLFQIRLFSGREM